jgi:hypothetical protein
VEAARQEDERRRWRVVRMGSGGRGGGGTIRGNETICQGKLEVNGRRTPEGLVDKRRWKRRRRISLSALTPRVWWNVILT